MALLLAGSLLSGGAASAATMALSTGVQGVAGSTVTTRLTVQAVGGLQMEALDIDIGYDPAQLTVLEVRCGPALRQVGAPATLIPCSVNPPLFNRFGGSGNELHVRGLIWSVPVTPADGDVLLEIDFRIVSSAPSGSTPLSLVRAQVNEPPAPSFTSVGPSPNATAGLITITARPPQKVAFPLSAIGLLLLGE